MYYDNTKQNNINRLEEGERLVRGKLWFKNDTRRYGLIDEDDLWFQGDGLHCGQIIEVKINDELITDRILGRMPGMTPESWYLKHSKIELKEIEGKWINLIDG